jgi:hypothetical protein
VKKERNLSSSFFLNKVMACHSRLPCLNMMLQSSANVLSESGVIRTHFPELQVHIHLPRDGLLQQIP